MFTGSIRRSREARHRARVIVFLNGASSSGKTSIAKAIQEQLDGFPIYFSIDAILYGLPPSALARMTGGGENPGLPWAEMEAAYFASLRELSKRGLTVIGDHSILKASSWDRMRKELGDEINRGEVRFIAVRCGLDELKRRELARGDRTIGEAESQFETVHRLLPYDLDLDSTTRSPIENATMLSDFIRSKI